MNAPDCCTSTSTAPDRAALLADLDKSLRFPVLALLASSLAWLLVGSAGLLISAVKLHAPGMLANCEHLTFGRIYPAALNALLFGFASQAGLAVALWMLARLGATRLAWPGFALIGWFFWNIGLPIGLVGILLGDTTGFEWFELPRYATPIMFLAYALLGMVALATFAARQTKELYVSHWYLLAALFCFPWIYSAAQLLLVFHPLRGVMQAAVHGWATHGLFNLWLTPLGLAIIFYFIPKITGRPLYHRGLALFAFWTLVVAGAWAGTQPGLPLPAGFVSAGVAAGLLMIVPLIANAANWQQTLLGQFAEVRRNQPLQFICASALCYLLTALLGVLGSLRCLASVVNFTYLHTAQHLIFLLGFLGLGVAGAVYYFVPRLAQADFPCALSKKVHRFGSFGGMALLTMGLVLGGFVQGAAINNPGLTYIDVVKSTKPWLHITASGLALLVIANGAFLFNFLLLISGKTKRWATECVLPELIAVSAPARTEAAPQPTAPSEPRFLPRRQPPPPRPAKKRRHR